MVRLGADQVAASDWERELVSASAPVPFRVDIMSVDEAAGKLKQDPYAGGKAIVILQSAQDALRLIERGFETNVVNVGGINFSEGRRRILPYLYLDDAEEHALREIAGRGVAIEIQDVPANRKWMLEDLVGVQGGSDSTV